MRAYIFIRMSKFIWLLLKVSYCNYYVHLLMSFCFSREYAISNTLWSLPNLQFSFNDSGFHNRTMNAVMNILSDILTYLLTELSPS
jgi:hypothetical protein